MVVGYRHQRIKAIGNERLNWVWILIQDSIRQHLTDAMGGVRQGEIGCADFIKPGLINFGKFLVGKLACRFAADFPRSFFKKESSLSLNAAHQAVEDHYGSTHVDFIFMVGTAIAKMKYHRRLCLADLSGQCNNFFGRNAGFFFGPLRRVRTHKILQLGKSQHPAVDIFGVIKPFL